LTTASANTELTIMAVNEFSNDALRVKKLSTNIDHGFRNKVLKNV